MYPDCYPNFELKVRWNPYQVTVFFRVVKARLVDLFILKIFNGKLFGFKFFQGLNKPKVYDFKMKLVDLCACTETVVSDVEGATVVYHAKKDHYFFKHLTIG